MSNPVDELQPQNEQMLDIGATLRMAREQKQITKEFAATQLKLRVATLDCLEDNRYEDLPGDTFIRGYIRSYANLLGLDGEDIARNYQATPVPGKNNYAPIKNIERANKTRFIQVLFLLLVVVLAGLGYYWWQEQKPVTQVSSPLPTRSAEVQVEGADGVLHIQSLDELNAKTAEMELEEVALTEPEPVAAPSPQTAATPAAAQENLLQFSFIEDCWIRVIDMHGNEIASGLKRAGEELSLTGKAPFEIHLGYAPGVFITYNGKQVDFDSSIRGNVARIKLG